MSLGEQLVVGLGEALFDCFPGCQVLGGAPVNLVVHLNALLTRPGGAAFPATRVGDDEMGRHYLIELTQRGVDTAYVQLDAGRPTGTVEVRPGGDGETEYRFADDTAWDRLEATPAWKDLFARCDAVCFGTLAMRSATNVGVLKQLFPLASKAVRLLDVNLRQDFYNAVTLDLALGLASAAKLNAVELITVAEVLGVNPTAEAIADKYDLDWVAVTRGVAGTLLYDGNQEFTAPVPAFDRSPQADSVGAGDACGAGLLFGVLQGWPFERTVALANALGAYVASQPGATPRLPAELLALSQ